MDGGNSWEVNSLITNSDLKALYFVSSEIGWSVGKNGTIIKTSDSGNTWINLSQTTDTFFSVFFNSKTTGWIVGDQIFKTIDGGITWVRQGEGVANYLRSVFFISPITGWNEGKSNILIALVLILNYLSERIYYRNPLRALSREIRTIDYNWNRDFPLKLQKVLPDSATEFKIEFELNELEKLEFRKKVKCKLTTNLIISLKLFKSKNEFTVLIKGRAKKNLQTKREAIGKFIRDHLIFQYIPSVRTANLTVDIIEDLIERALHPLNEDKDYIDLIKAVENYRGSILIELEKFLKEAVSEFLSDVKSIKLQQSMRKALRESCNIYVDDGNNTELAQKGDGIKSLIAISIVKYLSKSYSSGQSLILAIEEPESHLHPAAINKLTKVINEISKEHQVIITTHSPLLVDKSKINNNIIVNKAKAKPAVNIGEVRDILGVQVQDNLYSANLVLITEGIEDGKIIKTWVSDLSPELKFAFENNYIVFDNLKGGTNLSYVVSLYKNFMCDVVVFLDYDKCGKDSFDKAKKNNLLDECDVIFSKVPNYKTTELEDMVDQKIYIDEIKSRYGVLFNKQVWNSKTTKWSDRIKIIFDEDGKQWDDNIEQEVKKMVAIKVEESGLRSLKKGCKGPINNLIETLKARIVFKND